MNLITKHKLYGNVRMNVKDCKIGYKEKLFFVFQFKVDNYENSVSHKCIVRNCLLRTSVFDDL